MEIPIDLIVMGKLNQMKLVVYSSRALFLQVSQLLRNMLCPREKASVYFLVLCKEHEKNDPLLHLGHTESKFCTRIKFTWNYLIYNRLFDLFFFFIEYKKYSILKNPWHCQLFNFFFFFVMECARNNRHVSVAKK